MTDGRQPLSSRPRGTARHPAAFDDDELRAAWSRWLGTLRARGWDPSPVLRPGAAPSAIAAAEQAVGCTLPDPVRALYAITDGQADPAEAGGPVLLPARVLCPLRRVVELADEHDLAGRWPLGEGPDGLLELDADGRLLGSDLVGYLARLCAAELEERSAGPGGAVWWDAPDLR